MDINDLTGNIIGAAIEVHKILGHGLLESTYEECLCHELALRKISYQRQVTIPLDYKGMRLECGYRLDLLVESCVLVEMKACESIQPIHEAQLLTYLKLANLKLGLLINFNVPVLKEGIKRFQTENMSLTTHSLRYKKKGLFSGTDFWCLECWTDASFSASGQHDGFPL